MALSKTTKDHEEIRRWAESRGAVPSEAAQTGSSSRTGVLRLKFPKAKNRKDESLDEISWDDFFEKFDASDLEMVYQEKTASGQKSNFNKLIYPDSERRKTAGSSKRRRSGSRAA